MHITPLSVYNMLAAGSKLQLTFATKIDAQDFRQAISVIKSRTEKHLSECGHHVDDCKLKLSYDESSGVATYSIEPVTSRYEFTLLNVIPPSPLQC